MTSAPTFDLVVIGAGPAGSAAAITAARAGARVLLAERGRFPRHKVCGEFISPESLDLLHDLLRDIPEAGRALAAAPRIDRARVWLGGRKFEAAIDPPAASVARYDLDAWLWRAAQLAGVEVRQAEVQTIAGLQIGSGDGACRREVVLRTSSGETEKVCAAVAINAAGRSSRVLPQKAERADRWVGLKAHLRTSSGTLANSTTELFAFEGGYCGVQPVLCGEELYLNACALVREGAMRTLSEVFGKHPRLRKESARWQQATETVATAAVAFRPPQTEHNAMLLAGDAAGFIDPFVGDGIAIALRSGSLAGECAVRVSSIGVEAAIEDYSRRYHAAFDRAFRNASRLRRVMDMPGPARAAAVALLKLPGAAKFAVRSTRSA